MHFHCGICDKIKNEELINNYLGSKFHTSLVNSAILTFIIPYSNPREIEDTIRRYLSNHYEKYNKFQVVLLLKLLKALNQIKQNRIQRSSYRYRLCLPNAFFFSKIKIIKEQLYFQILDLRITFVSSSENMTYEYYPKQPKSMQEWKLLAKLEKNPELVCLFGYRHCSHPLVRE